MEYVVAELSTVILFSGFLAVTVYERRRGARFFVSIRERLDTKVAKIQFIFSHVSFEAFVRDTIRDLFERGIHAVMNVALRVTRFTERQLSRSVSVLRKRAAQRRACDSYSVSPFVRTMTNFKKELKTDRSHAQDTSSH